MDDNDPDRDIIDKFHALLANPPAYLGGSGRGIVIPAGGQYLVGALVIIETLNALGCKMPVEVWHQGPGELTQPCSDMIRQHPHITFRDVGRTGGPREQGGWQLKAEALTASRFDEVLLLDADNLPLRDPTHLFHEDSYRWSGSVFWLSPGDSIPEDSDVWDRVGLTKIARPTIESGQMMVDRRRAWPGVVLADFFNRHSQYWWRDLWGDKDTFLLAWLRTDTSFYLMPKRPVVLNDKALLHVDLRGEPLFLHRYGAKWKMGINPKFTEHPVEIIALRTAQGLGDHVTKQ